MADKKKKRKKDAKAKQRKQEVAGKAKKSKPKKTKKADGAKKAEKAKTQKAPAADAGPGDTTASPAREDHSKATRATVGAPAAGTATDTPSLTIASRVREVARAHDARIAGDFVDALNIEVAAMVEQAALRARENGRATLRPSDL